MLMAEDIYDRQYFYTFENINLLLKNMSNNQYIIPDEICKYSNCNEIIKKVCYQLSNGNGQLTAAAIPINYDLNSKCFKDCLHWTALVITLDNNLVLRAFYIDSLGVINGNIFQSDNIIQALVDNGIESIQSYLIKQHTDLFDCGPWCVFNLDSLARTSTLPKGIDELVILRQRKMLKNLFHRENVNRNIMKTSLKSINISKNSPREIIIMNKEINRCQDVRKIEQMVNGIVLFENGRVDIVTTLNLIGKLCGEITRENYAYTPSCDDIRYQYGFIQRNSKNKTINRNGIYFEKFHQLKLVLKHKNEFSLISDNHFQQLGNNLCHLKHKLLLILKEESQLIHQHNLFNQIKLIENNGVDCMDIFINITNIYYEPILIDNIKSELLLLDDINYDNIKDRYLSAHVLIRIGDLLHELIDERSISNNIIFDAFRDLFMIRSKIIHSHKKVRIGHLFRHKSINKMIKNLKIFLFQCISPYSNIDKCLQQSCDDVNPKSLKIETNSLLTYFKGKLSTTEKESNARLRQSMEIVIKTEKIKYNLDQLIFQASKIIHGITPNRKQISIDQRLSYLDKSYQLQFNTLNEVERIGYPLVLNLTNSNLIIPHSELHVPIKPSEDEEMENQKLNMENKLLNEKIKGKINDINEEINYLLSLENVLSGNDEKNIHIIEYIQLVVSQYVRDIEQLYRNTTSSTILYKNSATFEYVFNKKFNQTKTIPFNGHLLKKIMCDVRNEHGSVEYLYAFQESEKIPVSSITLCNVGVSFSKLGLYCEAVGYLKKASKNIKKYSETIVASRNPNDCNFTNNEQINDYFCMTLFGNDRYSFHINTIFANLLHLAGGDNDNDAIKVFEKISKRIKFDYVIAFANDNIKMEIYNFCNDYANCLIDLKKYRDAIDICRKGFSFYQDNIVIKMKLFEALFNDCQFDDAMVTYNDILVTINDDIVKLNVMHSFVIISLNHSDVTKALHYANICLENIKKILQNNDDNFNQLFQSIFLLSKLKIIYIELTIIIDCKELTIYQINEVYRLENEITSLINNLKEYKNKTDPTVALIYMMLCWIYSILECDINIGFDKKLKKAKTYFDKAVETVMKLPIRFPNIDQKLRETADTLSLAFNRYSIVIGDISELELFIRYLNFAKIIQEKYNISRLLTVQNLALLHELLAQKYLDQYFENSEILHLENALQNLDKSIVFLKLQSSDIQIIESLKHKLDSNTDYRLSELIIEQLKHFAFCYHNIANLRNDLKYIKLAIYYYEAILNNSSSVDRDIIISNEKFHCEYRISMYVNLLEKLLYYYGEVVIGDDIDDKMIELCNTRFNIRLQLCHGTLIWENWELFLTDELKLIIKKELNGYLDD